MAPEHRKGTTRAGRARSLISQPTLAAILIFMKHALMVTAHHDDAVLWGGGAILRTTARGWKWTIVAMCAPDPERRAYFEAYCRCVGAGAVVFQHGDYQEGPAFKMNSRSRMADDLRSALSGNAIDHVFTHSRSKHCEYGHHANHEEVRLATEDAVNASSLAPNRPIAYFCYYPIFGFGGLATAARLEASYYLQLNYGELAQKYRWCASAPDALTNLSGIGFPCPNPEGFEGDGLTLPEPFIPGGNPQHPSKYDG